MRRGFVAAAAIAILVLLAGAIYLATPQVQSTSQSSGSQSSVTASASTSSSTLPVSSTSSSLSSVSSSSRSSATITVSTATSSSSSTTSSTSSSASSASSGTSLQAGWTTYHGDNLRSGVAAVSNFTSVTRGWTSNLDGAVYAEPLVYGGDVFIATENNSVYAFDAQSGSLVWRTNLGPPVDGSTLPCGNINPTGITGTPVIDPSTGTLYVVSFSALHHTLSALKVSTGAVVFQRSAVPAGFPENTQEERSALSLASGMVYVPYGGLPGDCGQYWGWVVGLPADGTAGMAVYKVPTAREGGIWAPSGAAADSAGKIYVAIGNAASTTTFDYGNSVIKLSPSLSVQDYFAPTNWAPLSQSDTDVGSTTPEFVGPNLIFQVGKEGVGYLLNASRLGGIGGQLFSGNTCKGAFAGLAFSSPYIFLPCRDGLVALRVDGGSNTFTTAWRTSSFFAGPPVVTGGVVWTVNRDSASLVGYSVSSGHQDYSFQLGTVVHFCSLAAGDGRVFVTAGSQVISFVLH